MKEKSNKSFINKNPSSKGYLTIFCNLIVLIIIIVIVNILSFNFVFSGFRVPTSSMENTIMTGDNIIAVRKPLVHISRQSPIVFKDVNGWLKHGEGKFLTKRLIGLPGDIVEQKVDGSIYVNGIKLNEPYVNSCHKIFPSFITKVPDNNLFVMGDNRCNSKDSSWYLLNGYENMAYVPENSLYGKIVIKYNIGKMEIKRLI